MSGDLRRTRVKICGITRAEDGLAAAAAGADAIGFVFWPGSARYVEPATARTIAGSLPPFVTTVGLFVDPDPALVRSILDVVPVGVLQVHGGEPAALCRSFRRPYLKAFAVGTGIDLLESLSSYGDAAGVLLDAPPSGGSPGGTGRTFDWNRVPKSLPRPLVLSGGLDAGNVGEAIRRLAPWAVDVSSGVEAVAPDGAVKKGIKDAVRIAAFIAEVRHADGCARPA